MCFKSRLRGPIATLDDCAILSLRPRDCVKAQFHVCISVRVNHVLHCFQEVQLKVGATSMFMHFLLISVSLSLYLSISFSLSRARALSLSLSLAHTLCLSLSPFCLKQQPPQTRRELPERDFSAITRDKIRSPT